MKKNVECFGKVTSSQVDRIESLLDSSLALFSNDASNYFIDIDEITSSELGLSDSEESVLPKLVGIFGVTLNEIKDVSLISFYCN